MDTKFICKAAGYYVSRDGRTTVQRVTFPKGRQRWSITHGDVVGPRAFAAFRNEAMEKALVLRDGWDILDTERARARHLGPWVPAQGQEQ